MKVGQKMEEMASEAQHAKDLQEWHQNERKPQMFRYAAGNRSEHVDNDVNEMLNMYRKSIENSGVRVVSGDSLVSSYFNNFQDVTHCSYHMLHVFSSRYIMLHPTLCKNTHSNYLPSSVCHP